MGKPMTEQEITAFLDMIVQERIERERHSRDEKAVVRHRRDNKVRKNDRVMRIVTTSYGPRARWLDWDFNGRTLLHSGKYIKFSKNSNRQRWLKRQAAKKCRNSNGFTTTKGSGYKRVFDYWWELD